MFSIIPIAKCEQDKLLHIDNTDDLIECVSS